MDLPDGVRRIAFVGRFYCERCDTYRDYELLEADVPRRRGIFGSRGPEKQNIMVCLECAFGTPVPPRGAKEFLDLAKELPSRDDFQKIWGAFDAVFAVHEESTRDERTAAFHVAIDETAGEYGKDRVDNVVGMYLECLRTGGGSP